MDCIFCKIVNKEVEASVVFEDDKCIAFLDIQPVNPGHTLVIPKKHFVNLGDCPDELASHIITVVKKINKGLSESVKCEGVFNAVMNGEAASQEVFHLHFHAIPRFKGDGFGFKFDEAYGVKLPPREELNDIANRIRSNLI